MSKPGNIYVEPREEGDFAVRREHSKRARGAYHSSDEAPAHAGTATTEAELPIFTQKSILDDVYFRPEPEELHEAKQASSEDPSQWFAREIGLDGFNYVG